MGGCLDQPSNKKKNKVIAPGMKTFESNKIPANRSSIELDLKKPTVQVKPKYKVLSIFELMTTYKIQQTLQLSSKMQGPKYLSNQVDGSSKILRIFNLSDIDEKRLDAFKRIIGFEVYKTEEDVIYIIDEYCAGEDIHEMIQMAKEQKDVKNEVLHSIFMQIYKIIEEFHKNKIWLGNLNFSSFRKVSAFDNKIRLVDFNMTGQISQLQKVGFAHKESFEADFQFLGYLLQLMVSQQSPVFIPHKIQYVEFNQSVPLFTVIQKLLKGNKITEIQLNLIKPENMLIKNKVNIGYKFRRDVNKLLKMRRKRKAHDRKLYGEDVSSFIDHSKFQEDSVYRYETQRIFTRISKYINEIKIIHEEAFLNYSGNNEQMRKFKEVFLFTDQKKKMGELRECLSTSK